MKNLHLTLLLILSSNVITCVIESSSIEILSQATAASHEPHRHTHSNISYHGIKPPTDSLPVETLSNSPGEDALKLFRIDGGKSIGCGRGGSEFLEASRVDGLVESLPKEEITKESLYEQSPESLVLSVTSRVPEESDRRTHDNEKTSYRPVLNPYKEDIIPVGLLNRNLDEEEVEENAEPDGCTVVNSDESVPAPSVRSKEGRFGENAGKGLDIKHWGVDCGRNSKSKKELCRGTKRNDDGRTDCCV